MKDADQRTPAVRFLTHLGVDESTAEALWKMRQVVHGARRFDPQSLPGVGELLQSLRAATLLGLKRARSVDDDDLPSLESGGMAISTTIGFGGLRAIGAHDVYSGVIQHSSGASSTGCSSVEVPSEARAPTSPVSITIIRWGPIR